MIEIKFCGRGGQGAVIASQILAKVFFLMGKYPQCFSVFGGERRGAPVASFLRVDNKKIYLKCEIRRPDHLIYMAPDLVDEQEIESILKPDGLILINNALTSGEYVRLRKFRLALIDALSVSEEAGLGSTINTAILGAYAKASGEISLDYLEQAIRETVPAKIEANVTAALHAFDVTHVMEGVN
ncbi:MAG: 2-oxoacid:acceptor oxidoreductase family protein [Syntrophorhabdus sp.]|mgnify:FL=1|jgi:2-oxoacid:acceptor oxidoreductase gamma subunit (pyruvate/2-ketoisovalerate family)|nr:2-oxoacid:acceptor oxidoreductase family protein [Syntrophorhabdus sp.]MDI9558575.1 2-oxoacid:acceptor oxidoreductase family protein [Pseudomonadota bacterium]OPX93515.1 MAG: NADH-dependent phenylglyoxylate dehydrogenase subunit gamma [Syntrophorhabdus sp. PtaB.Bin027]OQB77632.1 MAG: NADH-dependent phenylglyoxylate dehydrogenase subunit gamma [Deltaproteobacteria bacterium ADurb.Bin135]MBP8743657.1 2-oxoacid:acceptor oxidoreductase family protein [Syntrophorhabdus sp.]